MCFWTMESYREVREGKRIRSRETKRCCRDGEILGLENAIGFGKGREYLRTFNLKLMGIGNQRAVGMRDKYKLKMTL